MATSTTTASRVSEYLDRVQELYASIKEWMRNEDPEAEFTETYMGLNERLTGRYKAKRLKVCRVGHPALTFVPRGASVVGARGRVDVLSPLGSESLVWVEAGGPAIAFQESVGGEAISSSRCLLFPGVSEGWAWVNNGKTRLEHLTRDLFLKHIARPLSE